MSKYEELRMNPPKLTIKKGAREVIFTVVSCMYDNVYHFTFKKNDDGDFEMHCGGFAYSNFQIKHPKHDVEWEADENEWDGVIAMINSGKAVVSEVKSR